VSCRGALLSAAEQSLYIESRNGQWSQIARGSRVDSHPKGAGFKEYTVLTNRGM